MADPNENDLRQQLAEAERKCLACGQQVVGLTSEVARLTEAAAVSRRAVATRNEFLAMVAHDLRSPLSVVTLSAGVLHKMMTTLEAGRPARKLVQRIQHSTDLMTHFVSDLLDVSQVEAGRLSLKRAYHEVAGLVAETCDTLSALCDEKGLALKQDIRVTLGSEVNCDRARFLQLMSNLVGNAIKFTERGGEIVVAAVENPTQFAFSVTDNGRGIPEEELPHVFEQYWKGKRSRDSMTEGGFGLGLVIVRNLVEAHGGTVSVISGKNKGSTFAFTLPRDVVRATGTGA